MVRLVHAAVGQDGPASTRCLRPGSAEVHARLRAPRHACRADCQRRLCLAVGAGACLWVRTIQGHVAEADVKQARAVIRAQDGAPGAGHAQRVLTPAEELALRSDLVEVVPHGCSPQQQGLAGRLVPACRRGDGGRGTATEVLAAALESRPTSEPPFHAPRRLWHTAAGAGPGAEACI